MTVDEIKEFLKVNATDEKVKAFVAELSPAINAESAKAFLDTDDGKRLVQPIVDRRVGDALKTYKEGHYDDEVKAAVAVEILKRNPKETEEQKRIREIEGKLTEAEAKAKRAELKRQGMEVLTQNGVPSWWIDQFSGNTIEELTVFADQVKKSYSEREDKVRNELLSGGFKPGSGGAPGGKGPMTFSQYKALPQAERIKMQENGEAAKLVPG
jgi:aspartyl/asparaginyl-tRNA synthetase